MPADPTRPLRTLLFCLPALRTNANPAKPRLSRRPSDPAAEPKRCLCQTADKRAAFLLFGDFLPEDKRRRRAVSPTNSRPSPRTDAGRHRWSERPEARVPGWTPHTPTGHPRRDPAPARVHRTPVDRAARTLRGEPRTCRKTSQYSGWDETGKSWP